jgi:hypothetical protein
MGERERESGACMINITDRGVCGVGCLREVYVVLDAGERRMWL